MPDGNAAQTRAIIEQALDAAVATYPPKAVPVPPPLKWAGIIVAGIMTAGATGLLFWMISSISDMQMTLARMDERQVMNAQNLAERFETIDSRLGRLEAQREDQRNRREVQ